MAPGQRAPAADAVDGDRWISPATAARQLEICDDVIYNRLNTGTFPGRFKRIGRRWWLHAGDIEAIGPAVRRFHDLRAAEL